MKHLGFTRDVFSLQETFEQVSNLSEAREASHHKETETTRSNDQEAAFNKSTTSLQQEISPTYVLPHM